MRMESQENKRNYQTKIFLQRTEPKWHSIPAEKLFKLGHYNDTKENNKFVNTSLIQF